MRRIVRRSLVPVLLLFTACSGDSDSGQDTRPDFFIPDFSGITDCLNSMATDDNCPQKCFKERGQGVSYCAHTCTKDPDCSGKAHAWIPAGVGLVCHPNQGFCTRRCMVDFDCIIGKYGDKMRCDPVTQVCASCAGGC